MAYATQTVTAITDIPAIVGSFAKDTLGWTVNVSTPSAPVITMPTSFTPINFQVTATITSQDHEMIIAANGSGVTSDSARFRSPKLAPTSGTTAVPQIPARVHLFGKSASPASDTPFLAVVVEYNENLFRHMYLGCMEKIGNYTGGEVIATVSGPLAAQATDMAFNEYQHTKYLFNARSGMWAATTRGGVRVAHADNPNTWRKFQGYGAGTISDLPADSVLGGFSDGINDGQLTRGESSFSNLNVLVPINLYTVKPITGDMSFVPIGTPPGVRMVHMKNLDPKASIDIGGVQYRVFPALAKNVSQNMPRASANGNWRTYETSYYVGYAYREN